MEKALKLLKGKRLEAILFIIMGLFTYTILTMLALALWQNGQDYGLVFFLVFYLIIQLYGIYYYMNRIKRAHYDIKHKEVESLYGTVESLTVITLRVKEGDKGIVRLQLFKKHPENIGKIVIGQKVKISYFKKTKYLVEITSIK